MFRDVKVVFQDVDGCLNTPDASDLSSGPEGGLTTAQQRLLAEIGRAIDASSVLHVVLNTGRSLAAVQYIADAIGSHKVRYLLTEHAAHGFDAHESTVLDLAQLAESWGLRECAARYAGLRQMRSVIDWYQSRGQQLLSEKLGVALPALPKGANLTLAVPEGMPPADLIEALETLLSATEQVESEGLVYHHNPYYVDVISQVGKGDGALVLLQVLGVSKREALAVGDGGNDASMFEALERGFCPANAAPELQRLCRSKGGAVSEHTYGAAMLELYGRLR